MNMKPLLLSICLIALNANEAIAGDKWFARPYAGTSQIANLSADFTAINGLSGEANIRLEDGFTSGIGIGYRYNNRFAAELGWEYRSNDSSATLANTYEFESGDYASNIFYLNGHYMFAKRGKLQPYAGAGLTWIQEIDIDLEQGGIERSFSGSGDLGYQVFAGFNYDLNQHWALQSELRYGSISDIELQAEGTNSGQFKNLNYETTTFQIGLVFKF